MGYGPSMNDAPTIAGNASEVVEQPPAAQNPTDFPRAAEPIPAAAPEPAPPIAPAPATEPAKNADKSADKNSATAAAPPAVPIAPSAAVTAEATPSSSGIGVLLVNLGTPEAATPAAIRKYLQQFLTDKRVIKREFAAVEVRPQRHHPADPLAAQSARLRKNLEQGEKRVAAQDHHARAGGEAFRHPRTARQACPRQLGDALR